jgi:hypothetical protein
MMQMMMMVVMSLQTNQVVSVNFFPLPEKTDVSPVAGITHITPAEPAGRR